MGVHRFGLGRRSPAQGVEIAAPGVLADAELGGNDPGAFALGSEGRPDALAVRAEATGEQRSAAAQAIAAAVKDGVVSQRVLSLVGQASKSPVITRRKVDHATRVDEPWCTTLRPARPRADGPTPH